MSSPVQEVDDEFSRRLADLVRRIEDLPAERREQLEREIDELKKRKPEASDSP